MNKTEELLALVTLESIELNLFRGQNETQFGPRLFGGQVLAQSLTAAINTVSDKYRVHSAHGYFLRPGDTDLPVLYQVERIRDGRSFVTRRVKAIQHGKAIFSMDTSFHVAEPGLEHQIEMKRYPDPDELEDDQIVAARIPDSPMMSGWAKRERGFDLRSVVPLDQERPSDYENPVWLRFRAPIPDFDPRNQQLLAYASDMGFVSTAFLPHRHDYKRSQMQTASLDHALWFHHSFNVSDWFLYVKETTTAAASRGFNRGSFYDRSGKLVASSIQEGLMRVRR